MEGFIGEIRAFAGSKAPNHWMFCNGAILRISQYEALYSLIGYTYGGDKQTTFALPNFSTRIAVGQDPRPGITKKVMGFTDGAEYVQLGIKTLPQHSHSVNVVITNNTKSVPDQSSYLGTMNSPEATVYGFLPGNAQGLTDVKMDYRTISYVGGGGLHYNMMPVLVTNYIICVEENLYPDFR